MASSFEKSVKGATKIKAAPPKTKYIEHILVATHAGEAGVGEVFRALQNRLHDSTWTVVFKSLITVHLMIREGSPDVTLAYLSKHRNILAVSVFSDAQTQGRNIRHYANYLSERARAYRDTKIDWVRAKESRLEKLTVEKGLLRETETIQQQLTALLSCDVMENEPENEITITTFRLLVLDLLQLFQVLNQAMINILGHFFEMSKPDAERAMEIYRKFTRQTDFVVQYLSIARQYEHHTRVEVPKLKHAPVNLGRQLEEYLKDPDFEIHRRQYLAEQEAKKSKGGASGGGSGASKLFKSEAHTATKSDTAEAFSTTAANGSSSQQAPRLPEPVKGPDQDLIDFFDSIEQNQTPMATQPQPQQQVQVQAQMPVQQAPVQQTGGNPWMNNGFQMQQQPTGQVQMPMAQPTGFAANSPFQQANMTGFVQQQQQQQPQQTLPTQPQLQTNFTGAGFGGFTPQQSFSPGGLSPIPQDTVASFQSGAPTGFQTLQMPQQNTNPFRQSMLMTGQQQPPNTTSPFAGTPPLQQQRPQTSGQSTNPFARASPPATQPFASPTSTTPFQTQPLQQPPQQQQQQQQLQQQQQVPLQAMPTGTNPFAKTFGQPQQIPQQQQQLQQQQQQRPVTAGAIAPQATGVTNPFRQGAFVNHTTGMGWQHQQAPIGGGLDQLETIAVFPRPTQQTPWQQ